MPLAAMTQAVSRANSAEWLRQSMHTATPFFIASVPSARMTLAKPCVAQRMTWRFMLCSPVYIVPRRPAVPNSSGP